MEDTKLRSCTLVVRSLDDRMDQKGYNKNSLHGCWSGRNHLVIMADMSVASDGTFGGLSSEQLLAVGKESLERYGL